MNKEQKEIVTDVSDTRNSKFRKRTAGMTKKVAEAIDKYFPHVTPDMITALGTVGTIYGGYLANHENKPNKKLALGIIIGSQALDAIDGALARAKERKGKKNNPNGQIVDAIADRTSEAGLGLIRAESAKKRKDSWGRYSALLATATNPLPSTARAYAESNGVCVEESGNSVISFLGTRAGRAALGTIATVFPTPKNIPLQTGLDTLTAYANLKTTYDRLKSTNKNTTPNNSLNTDEKVKAKKRLKAMVIYTTATAGIVLYSALRNPKK